jgi:hypothetical protein
MNAPIWVPFNADVTWAFQDWKFVRLSFSFVGRKVKGKMVAVAEEEEDVNAMIFSVGSEAL